MKCFVSVGSYYNTCKWYKLIIYNVSTTKNVSYAYISKECNLTTIATTNLNFCYYDI